VKTLAEIAIEAGLVTKAGAAKAGRMAEERKEPLVVVLIRELGVDEVTLIGALRKQTRVPLLDPGHIQLDVEALRLVPRDACARLRVLPFALTMDAKTRVLRVAMADPTDTAAILELEVIANCEIEVTALPLSAIEELVDRGYKQFSTAVVPRPRALRDSLTGKHRTPQPIDDSQEVSVTAQIPMSALTAPVELQFRALCQLLVSKGVITEADVERLQGKVGVSEP